VLLKSSPEDRFQTFLEIHSLRIQIDRSLSCFISFYEARASYEEKKKVLKEKEIYCFDFGNKISLVFLLLFFIIKKLNKHRLFPNNSYSTIRPFWMGQR
jgi:hypothetical protein